ncbi:MAG TPA: HD domain-containing phosphohydrolase [Pyrinomonadaceae bacterium]|nr:HD domain-containing phosphohydrolase [Pyrinomonadaceae bacterium]
MGSSIQTSGGSLNLEAKVFRKLAQTTDQFESYANPHAERIATLVTEIARKFSLASKDLHSLRTAAFLHDLGEATMARDYIKRGGTLSTEERLDLERHALIGEQETANSGGDRAAQLIVRWHHEWWNGSGYPDRLQREEIPLAARILRVADSYAALTDRRPFREALTKEGAREHMAEWAGIEFDPRIVEALLSLGPIPELESFAISNAGLVESKPPEREWKLFSSFNS